MRGNGRAWVWCQRSLRGRGIGEALHMTSMDLERGGPPEGLVVKSPDTSSDRRPCCESEDWRCPEPSRAQELR